MKVCKVSFDGSHCIFSLENREHLDLILDEVRLLVEESCEDDVVTLSMETMEREEFDNLDEFQGY